MLTCSRIFSLSINGKDTEAFVPFADMTNHNSKGQTTWLFDDLNKCFVFKATKDLNEGEQRWSNYGSRCNSDFFFNYGFINIGNQYDDVLLRLTFETISRGFADY